MHCVESVQYTPLGPVIQLYLHDNKIGWISTMQSSGSANCQCILYPPIIQFRLPLCKVCTVSTGKFYKYYWGWITFQFVVIVKTQQCTELLLKGTWHFFGHLFKLTYSVMSNGEQLIVRNIVRNCSLWSKVVFRVGVNFHSLFRVQAWSLFRNLKANMLCNISVLKT